MAYALYEGVQLKDPKSVQYYPEEYDYAAYYDKISSVKHNYTSIQSATKKPKKNATSVNFVNEKKCPIYVHQYNKSPVSSMYNNYLSLKSQNKSSTEKSSTSKAKKIHNPHSNKSVLDKLEETYWATWKPNKENNSNNRVRKNKANEDRTNRNKAYGDTSETLIRYFATADFNVSTMSVLEDGHSDKYNQKLELVSSSNIDEDEKYTPKLAAKTSQEIQTEGYPLILPKIEENIESTTNLNKEKNNGDTDLNDAKSLNEVAELGDKVEAEIEKEKSDSDDDSKLLKHTDSLIINKKKQTEIKEYFQQPRCIKLYKKPGTSTSFIRGGSYPLKSCLKREPVQKGNFKLGAPGSPILVTTSSYSRKFRK